MHRTLMMAGVVLALAATVWSQTTPQPTPRKVTCPLDGHEFTVPQVERGDQAGGSDSDQCLHDLHGRTFAMEVTVCPRCNYAALTAVFAVPVPPAKKAALLRALAGSRYRGVEDSWTDIPAWERSRLADVCAVASEQTASRIDYVKLSAWYARIEACRPATVAVAAEGRVVMPLSSRTAGAFWSVDVEEVIRDLRRKIDREKKPGEKHRLMLHLAMMCQRGGFVKDRDDAIADLKKDAAADAMMQARLKRFEDLVALETSFQKQFVELARENLKTQTNALIRVRLSFVLADTLRRLGRADETVKAYRDARRLMTGPSDLRMMTDHFLTMLAPGEPLPLPGTEEPAVETPAPEATPEPVETVPPKK